MDRRDLLLICLILLSGPLSWVGGVVNWVPGESEKDTVLLLAYVIPYIALILSTAMLIISLSVAARDRLLNKVSNVDFKAKLWTLPVCVLGLFFIASSQSIASVDIKVELPDSKVLPSDRN